MKYQTEGPTELNGTSLLSFGEMAQRHLKEIGTITHPHINRTIAASLPQSKNKDAVNKNRMVLPMNSNIIPNGKRAPFQAEEKAKAGKDGINMMMILTVRLETRCRYTSLRSKVLSYEI